MAPSTVGPGPTQTDRCMTSHPPLVRAVIAAILQHIELEFCPLTHGYAFVMCVRTLYGVCLGSVSVH